MSEGTRGVAARYAATTGHFSARSDRRADIPVRLATGGEGMMAIIRKFRKNPEKILVAGTPDAIFRA